MKQFKWVNLSRNLLVIAELFLLLTILSAYYRVYAQDQSGVTLTAQVGLDGYCKEGLWVPVRVRVENTGPAVNGTVQVSFQNEVGGTSTYGQALSLPTTSRKDVFLHFYPPQYSRNLKVSLVEGDRVIADKNVTLSCLGADTMLFGVMSDDPSDYDILNEVKPLEGFVKVAHLRPADLPDRPQGWAGLDALIVANVDTGTFTPEQRESLSVWLANGGKLMVIGGPSWQATVAGLMDVLPVSVGPVQTASDPSLLADYFRSSTPIEGDVIVPVGRLRGDVHVLVQQNSIPLLVEREIGFGKVIYLAADPSLRPLSEWEGMKDVYEYLLGARSLRPEWVSQQWDVYSASRAVSTLDELSIPPILAVCGWLILYVLVIGPVNFLVLRRLKRRDLAWLTIPVLAILFSSMAYFYGSVYRGPLPVLNRIAVIQGWDNSPVADVQALVGFYSPRRAKYTLETNEQFMFYPFQSNGSGLQGGNNWYSLKDADGSLVIPDVQVEIGGMKSFSMRGSLPAVQLRHDLVITISKDDPLLTGTITNNSDLILRDVVLFTPGKWEQLGDLVPGASRPVSVGLAPASDKPEFYGLQAYQLVGSGSQIYGQDQGPVRREALLNAVLNSSGNYYGNYGNWGIYLMGWIDQPLLPVNVRGGSSEAIDTALCIVRLTPQPLYKSTTWNLTPALMTWEASSPDASPYFGSEVPPGGHTFRFRPAMPLSFGTVEQLTLNISAISGAAANEAAVSLWNFDSSQWERIEIVNWGLNDIPEPARFVGPGGETRLKIASLSNYSLQVSPATLSLVVGP